MSCLRIAPNADDDVNVVVPRSRRQCGVHGELDGGSGNIRELAGIDVIEMVVALDPRVEIHARRIRLDRS
jgi:hypothetical protein